MTRIKICGLTRREDVRLARSLGADWLGFIHVPGSPRFVDLPQLEELLAEAQGTTRVVVVRNLPPEDLARLRASLDFAYFQFHGQEGPEYLAYGGYRVFHIYKGIDDSAPETFGDPFLLDTAVGNQQGGTGVAFDWSVLPQVKGRFLVAGGLTPDNVGDLIATYHPWGVDVSSGVEERPGIKSRAKLTSFIENVRRHRRHD